MTDEELVAELRRGHVPRRAALDEGIGMVCTGHGMGYPPPYPCLAVRAADRLEVLHAENERLRAAAEVPPSIT